MKANPRLKGCGFFLDAWVDWWTFYILVFKYQIYILLDNIHSAVLSFRKLMNCIFEGRVP